MCGLEGLSLQRGMNCKVRGGHGAVLMSRRPGAPYRDSLSADGTVLFYEGHDAPRNMTGGLAPKTVDPPLLSPGGRLTPNGLFFQAAQVAGRGEPPNGSGSTRRPATASGPLPVCSCCWPPSCGMTASGR